MTGVFGGFFSRSGIRLVCGFSSQSHISLFPGYTFTISIMRSSRLDRTILDAFSTFHCHEKSQAAVSVQTRAYANAHMTFCFCFWFVAFFFFQFGVGHDYVRTRFERAFYTVVFVFFPLWHGLSLATSPRRQFGYFYHRPWRVKPEYPPLAPSLLSNFLGLAKFLYWDSCAVVLWVYMAFFVFSFWHRDPGFQPYPVVLAFFLWYTHFSNIHRFSLVLSIISSVEFEFEFCGFWDYSLLSGVAPVILGYSQIMGFCWEGWSSLLYCTGLSRYTLWFAGPLVIVLFSGTRDSWSSLLISLGVLSFGFVLLGFLACGGFCVYGPFSSGWVLSVDSGLLCVMNGVSRSCLGRGFDGMGSWFSCWISECQVHRPGCNYLVHGFV